MRFPETAGRFEILLVEDSPTDILLTQEALSETTIPIRLHVAEDGVRAMAFLRKEGGFADAPRPDLILLDLNMPRKDGREVLVEVKADADLKIIPVIVLSTSSAESDVLNSYKLHANCYITKPFAFDSFVEMLKALEQFWFGIVTLPPGHG